MPSLEPLVEAWNHGRGDIPPSCQAPGRVATDDTPFPPIKKWLFFAWTWKSLYKTKKRYCWLLKIIIFCVFHFMGWIFSRGPIHASFSEPCFERSRMSLNNSPPKEKKTSYNESPIRKSRCDRKTISTIHCSIAIYFSNNIPGTFLKRQNPLSKSCASSRPKKKTYTTHSCLSPPSFGSPC